VDCQFFQGLNLAQGTLSDVWVVVTPNPSAGGTPSETFSASIVFESDVAVTPASAFIAQGAHRPVTGTLHVVDFAVASFTPAESGLNGGASIMIRGSGFADPVKLTIGGVLCGGTAIVNASGTEIRGLKVPKGTGENLPIVMQTNGLEPIVLTQTFTYSDIYEVEDKKGEGEGCAVGAPTTPLVALLLLGVGVLALRRRTRHGRSRSC
jgi:MYXO-CTERM domain-containing protein